MSESWWTLLWCLVPVLPPYVRFLWDFPFRGTSQCQVLVVSHTGLHPKNWLSGITTVHCTVQAEETSEAVASLADAYTSVSVLAKPALPEDATAAEGLSPTLPPSCSCVSSLPSVAAHCVYVRVDPACFLLVFFGTDSRHRDVIW